jgi:hypothetical protein
MIQDPMFHRFQFFRFAEALKFYPHASYQAGFDASQ